MHSAKLQTSERLQKVFRVLLQGPHTTREIIHKTGVCAVNSIADELRDNGIPVDCKCLRRGVFEYSIPEGQLDFDLTRPDERRKT